jgi:hypothetical protein
MRLLLGLVGAALVAGACSGVPPAPSTTPAPTPPPGPAKVLLRFHPPVGERYAVVQTQMVRTAPDSGSPQAMPAMAMTIRTFSRDSILERVADTIRVLQVIDSMHADMPVSTAPDMFSQARGMQGLISYDDRMAVRRAAFTDPGGNSTRFSGSMAEAVRTYAIGFPPQAVAVGDSWSTTINAGLGQTFPGMSDSLAIAATLTVDSVIVTGRDTTVLLKVRLVFPETPLVLKTGGVEMTMRMSGVIEGEELFSIARGVMLRSTMDGTMHMTMSSAAFGATPVRMAMTQHLTRQVDPIP